MKTFASVTILTIAFLSAGAFANGKPTVQKKENVTIIFKNSAWPVKGQITMDACSINACTDI
jgi:hypothetical protein